MKKHIKLLLLVVVALVSVALLVSCGGGSETSESESQSQSTPGSEAESTPDSNPESTPDSNPESTPDSTPGSDSIDFSEYGDRPENSFLVRFLGVDDEVIKWQWVKYDQNALAPRVPEPEGYKWTKQWDKSFRNVKEDTDVRAIMQVLELFTVSFVDANGSTVKSYPVYETKGLKDSDLPGNPGKVAGKVFMGWGLVVDGKDPTTLCKNEYKNVESNQVYKAIYKDADATAPFVTRPLRLTV